MVFKVIITHDSTEGDEHTYYGIVFPNRDIGELKELEYSRSNDQLEATFSFDENKVREGEHFLAILVPVNKSEIRKNNCGKIGCRVGVNTKKRAPEVVHF